MLSKLVIVFGLSETCSAIQVQRGAEADDDQFLSFIREYGRSYKPGSDEYVSRRALFTTKVARMREINSNPSYSWKAGVNKFADHTKEELAAQHGYNRAVRSSQKPLGYGSPRQLARVVHEGELPKEADYSHLKSMQKSEVMEQSSCGSCWAVATALTLRAHSELYTTDTKFSAQELVSCTQNPKSCGGTGGCSGATGELAFEYVLENGLRTEHEFPYTATDEKCPKALDSGAGGKSIGMTGWHQLPTNELKPVQQALATKGPLAVTVAADEYWFDYMSGIMDTCSNSDPDVNHLVVLIGYGSEGKQDYWKIQNSWGSDWGENGHMKILRTDDEEKFCGMDTKPRDGVACEGEDDPVKVCGHCGMLYDVTYPLFE